MDNMIHILAPGTDALSLSFSLPRLAYLRPGQGRNKRSTETCNGCSLGEFLAAQSKPSNDHLRNKRDVPSCVICSQ